MKWIIVCSITVHSSIVVTIRHDEGDGRRYFCAEEVVERMCMEREMSRRLGVRCMVCCVVVLSEYWTFTLQ